MPENFVVRLTPELVPKHIESRRKAIQRWAEENPDFVAKFGEERREWEAARAVKQNKQAAFGQSG
jgi:hypothetical protein